MLSLRCDGSRTLSYVHRRSLPQTGHRSPRWPPALLETSGLVARKRVERARSKTLPGWRRTNLPAPEFGGTVRCVQRSPLWLQNLFLSAGIREYRSARTAGSRSSFTAARLTVLRPRRSIPPDESGARHQGMSPFAHDSHPDHHPSKRSQRDLRKELTVSNHLHVRELRFNQLAHETPHIRLR